MKCKNSECCHEQKTKFKFCPECGLKAGNEDITVSEVAVGVTKTDGDVPNVVFSQPSLDELLPAVTTSPVKKKATDNDNLALPEVTTSSVEKHVEKDTMEATNNVVIISSVEKHSEQDAKKATNNEVDLCSTITKETTSRIPENAHEKDLCGTSRKGDKRKGTLKTDVDTGTIPPKSIKTEEKEVEQEVQKSPNKEFLEAKKTNLSLDTVTESLGIDDVDTGTVPPKSLKTEEQEGVQESPNKEFSEEKKTNFSLDTVTESLGIDDVDTGTAPPKSLKTEEQGRVQESPNKEFLEKKKTNLSLDTVAESLGVDENVDVAIQYDDNGNISVNHPVNLSKEKNVHPQASNSSDSKNKTETIQSEMENKEISIKETVTDEKACNEHGNQHSRKSGNDFVNERSDSKDLSLNKGHDNDKVQVQDKNEQGKGNGDKRNDNNDQGKRNGCKENDKTEQGNAKKPKIDESISKDKYPKTIENKKHTRTKKGQDSSRTEQKVNVVFHVLVSKSFHLDPKEHDVYIMCEPGVLGGWKEFKNKMTLKNKSEDNNLLEYEIEMMIPKKLEVNGFQYKYLIYKKGKWEFEFVNYLALKKSSDGNPNRRFWISKDWKMEVKGNWHRYDGFCYQKKHGLWSNIKSLFGSDDVIQLKSDVETAVKYFVLPFLEKSFRLVKDEEAITLQEICGDISMILHSLRLQMVDYQKDCVDEDAFKELVQNLIIERIINHVGKSETNNMLSVMLALFVMKLTNQYEMILSSHQRSVIYQSLLVTVDREEKKCHTVDFIMKNFDKKIIASSISKFILRTVDVDGYDFADPSWLLAVSLFHFLNGNSQPFIQPVLTSKHNTTEWWFDKRFDRKKDELKKKTWIQPEMEILEKISPLFEADYLLPRIFVAALTLEKVFNVIRTRLIPPEICCATLCYHLMESRSSYVKVATKNSCSEIFAITSESIQKSFLSEKGETVSKDLSGLLNIVKDLFTVITDRYADDFLCGSLKIVFAVFNCMLSVDKDSKEVLDLFTEVTRSIVDPYLKELTYYRYAYVYYFADTSLLKKINQLLMLEMSSNLQTLWDDIIIGFMNQFLKKLTDDQCLDIYCSEEEYCSKIQDILSERAFQAFDRQLQSETTVKRSSVKLGKLFSRSWQKFWNEYEKDNFYIFEWKPLIRYLKRFGGQEQEEAGSLPEIEGAQEQIICIVSLLEDYHTRIEKGEIRKKDIESILGKHDVSCPLIKIPFQESPLEFIFQLRQRELEIYEDYMKFVQSLIHICSHTVAIYDTDEHKRLVSEFNDLTKSDAEKQLTEIYNIPNIPDYRKVQIEIYTPIINPFEIPRNILQILPKLHELKESQLFVEIWKRHLDNLTTDSLFALIGEIWSRAIESWEQFQKELKAGDISFESMENHFKVFEGNYDRIEEEMMMVLKDKVIVRERISQIKTYHIVSSCQKASDEFLKIKKFLGLTDRFETCSKIARLATNNKTSMKEINQSVLQDLGQLKEIKKDEIKCLEDFRKAEPMVKWLQKTMKEGLKELKVFVDLAFISAGEGDMDIDKVNCFHAVTSAFAPLIFDLKQDSKFDEVMNKCNLVWKELQNDKNLTNKLHDTNNQLDWFKAVRQSHGSVEVTSLKQAEMIVAQGIYKIGFPKDKMSKTQLEVSKVLSLNVPELKEKKEHGSGKYTYAKLMDLQSRLMLVAGQAEKGNENIDIFTAVLDGAVRLAKSFVKLCTDGCVFFNSWKVQFLCNSSKEVCALLTFGKDQILKGHRNPDNVVDFIGNLANFLEKCHEDWLKYLNDKREEYLELNYYTVEQLVFLQQEIIKEGQGEPDPLIYPMLSLVKQDCSRNDLIEAMKLAMTSVSDKDKNMETLETTIEVELSEDEQKAEFIQYMLDNGFSIELAQKAYLNVKDKGDIDEGLLFCLNENDEECIESSVDKDELTAIPFTGWTTEQGTIEHNIACTLIMMPKSDRVTCKELIGKFEHIWNEFLKKVSSSLVNYLSLEHLGIILHNLAESNCLNIKRNLAAGLKQGVPNLIVCPQDDMLNYLTYMYMHPADQILPRPDEVLMCTKDTKYDEVNIFLRRAFYDSVHKLYCLAFADYLEYSIAEKVEKKLIEYSEENTEKQFKLVIFCTQENELKTRLVAALEKYRQAPPAVCTPTLVANYLTERLVCQDDTSACTVDFSRSSVRVIQSQRPGVGKTLYVKRLVEKLRKHHSRKKDVCLSIHLYEKDVDISHIVDKLMMYQHSPEESNPVIFHLDISSEVLNGVDFLLYNLLILGCLKDKDGRIWTKSPSDLYVIENIPSRNNPVDKKKKKSVHQIFSILPKVNCWSPLDTLKILQGNEVRDYHNKDSLFDDIEFASEIFQRPFQYLLKLEKEESLSMINVNEPEGTPVDCLNILLRHCGIQDPSWAEIHHFVWFLNTQLKDFETSSFCSAAVADDLPGFSKFVLQFSIEMSRDFATRSLNMSEETPLTNDTNTEETADLTQFQIKRHWESSPHPYIFFNPDHHSMTFLGFNIDKSSGNLIDQQTGHILKTNLVSKNLYDSLIRNRVILNENFNDLPRLDRISKLCSVMGIDVLFDPDPSYELTPDNAKKILAIYMRFRCNIPVIIMGETGCGKTRLIKFMCDLQRPVGTEINNMILIKVHGGTTSQNITEKVTEAAALAKENSERYGENFYTVLFFDEANTTEAIGLIKEIMCDGTMNGEILNVNRNLKIVAACNPYRKHTDELIKRLENAGLGYHVDADATTDRLGRVPMRRLVYRVQPLPSSMLPLVWDFGQLNVQIEELYIHQMVNRAIEEEELPDIDNLENSLSKVLIACQEFMRKQKNECSFVSLRDVERVIKVMGWFRTQKNVLQEIRIKLSGDEDIDDDGEDGEEMINDASLSLILALAVCYRAGLRCRGEFDENIVEHFTEPCSIPGGIDQFKAVIENCQEIFLKDVELDINIAKNQALKENVFLMVVCIELRIPLFLVGKPGSSKSLAKTIVADVMQGNSSRSEFFKHFKQIHMISFQCSPLSTAEGIVSTFKQSAKIQKEKNLDTFVATVVLDEIGLAEDSSRMPLKTLHPLLEDGCEGNEAREPHKKVAFVGISNWALDPAKMNRGISVQREVPENDELMETAKGICQRSLIVYNSINPVLRSLAESYLKIFEIARQKREFFGLRDFYSLVKMVYSFAAKHKKTPCWHQLEHCIRRNFGGLDTIDAVKVFGDQMKTVRKDEKPHIGDPSCTALGLIEAGLFGDGTQSDSRYLLLLTENYEALGILQEQILEKHRVQTIFGSSFPRDQEYTQVCRNINRIKVCMETGNTVILLNLENLYESLYDALNQYYAKFGGERYVDLGLGSHRVKCRVHKNFRLIVVAEKTVVYDKFPIPLINRLEKHFLTLNNIMSDEQAEMAKRLKNWAEKMVTKSNCMSYAGKQHRVSVEDAFMGYHSDAAAAIVMKVWTDDATEETKFNECKKALLWCCTPEIIVQIENSQLLAEKELLVTNYFEHQQHTDIFAYLNINLTNRETPLFAQITTHSTLLTEDERRGFNHDICLLHLQSFDTEQQFCKELRSFSQKPGDKTRVLIIQSDSQGGNTSLVKSAQYCVDDNLPRDLVNFHVIFIIQLDRISQQQFCGYQGGKWHCLHIDDLHPTREIGATLMQMQSLSVADLFRRKEQKANRSGDYSVTSRDSGLEISSTSIENSPEEEEAITPDDIQLEETIPAFTDQYVLSQIINCVQAAVGRVKDDKNLLFRPTQRVSILLSLLNDTEGEFSKGIISLISYLIKEKEAGRADYHHATKWLVKEACKPDNINRTGTFRRAWGQYLEEKITPILACIIAYIDKNLNLNIINDGTDWKKSVWLTILGEPKVCGLKYTDLISTEKMEELNEFVVRNTGYGRQSFQATFPFSWLFYDLAETSLHTSVGQDPSLTGPEIVSHTVDVIEKSQLVKILEDSVCSHNQKEEMFNSYLRDFIVMKYGPKDKYILEILYDILASALNQREFYVEELDISWIIAVVHYIHTITQYRIQHFLEIVHIWPGVVGAVLDLKARNTGHVLLNRNYMAGDVLSLFLLMEILEPQKGQLGTSVGRQCWYKETCRCLPVAERILELSSSTETVKGLEYHDACTIHLSQIRCLWTRIVTITLFVKHFSPADKPTADLYQSLKWQILWNLLGEEADMQKLKSLEKVEKFLKLINTAVLKKLLGEVGSCTKCGNVFESAPIELPCRDKICTECMNDIQLDEDKECPKCQTEIPRNFNVAASSSSDRESLKKLKNFQKSCDSFLMALVSKLCFNSNTAPDDDVVNRLMGYVTVKTTTRGLNAQQLLLTKPMSLFNHEIDPTPICRFFLLKLLTRKSPEYTSVYLDDFFKNSKELIDQTRRRTERVNESALIEFSALVSYCLEDVHYEKAYDFADQCNQEIDVAINNLETAAEYFRRRDTDEFPVIEQLENIVRCRYGLVVAAKYLHQYFVLKSLNMSTQFRRLVKAIENVTKIETTMMWPKKFLLKQICRKYGTECYEEIMSGDQYKWIGLERKRQVVPDRFVIYGKNYTNVRQAVKLLDLGEDVSKLKQSLKKVNNERKEQIFLMVLQNTVSTFENDETKLKLEKFIKGNAEFKLKNVALAILSTRAEQKNPFVGVIAGNPLEAINLETLLCHWLLVLNVRSTDGLLQPLNALIMNSRSMQGAFLPTMPEENQTDLSMIVGALKTRDQNPTVYRCPNGHAYIIGECGRPYTVSKCNQCNATIGGQGHQATAGNTTDDGQDRSKTGHILGLADQRPLVAIPERSMSPSVCVIIRMMTHMSMLLGAKQNPQDVANLVNPPVAPDNVEGYFTRHLQKDVAVLQKALQKSSDDVYLLIHLIFQHLLNNLPAGNGMNLHSKENRRTWEDQLSAKISEVLKKMEKSLADANQKMVENSISDEDNLLKILYEVESQADNMGLENLEINPIIWRYRERITVEHFLRRFQLKVIDQETEHDAQTYQLIRLFKQEKYYLQVLQFLPDIIKLQHALMQTFCRQIDRSEAQYLTIETVLKKYFDGNNEMVLQLENLIRTWETIKEKLISHVCQLRDGKRLVIPEEFHNMKIDQSTKLDFILPSVKGPGVCSYVMTEYLLRKHNSCLESYCLLSKQRFEDIPVVEIKDVSLYHLIAFHLEKDILPLVISNCNYSFQLENCGTEETYDFAGFENQLKDSVFTRKSRIKTEGHIIPIDTMLFKADSSNAVVFSALRSNIPQVSMNPVLKHQLSKEIQKLPDICDSLNNLDIANSFLKSLGGNPEASLHQFMSDTLKMRTTVLSQTARNECKLKHLQCLWLTLSFEKDKILAASSKELFVDLDDEVKQEMEDNDSNYFLQEYQKFGVDKLNVLLHLIYDSILLRIAQTKDPQDDVDFREMRLRDILMTELDTSTYTEPPTEHEQLGIDIFIDWPESVVGSQAIHVWNLLLKLYLKKMGEL